MIPAAASVQTAAAAIELRGLSFRYDGPTILDKVDLTIARGDMWCVVGPNGGGKTTLLKLMLGLLTPTRGTVRVFGKDPRAARHRIGYVPQNAQIDLHFPISVMEVSLLGRLRSFGGYRAADRAAAEASLRDVGLLDCSRMRLSSLSGGQRQRVLIARALAGCPDLLLLDEPTANLDPRVEDEFYKLLHELNQRLTIVVVSHDLRFVSQYVQKVVCVSRGVHVHATSAISSDALRDIYGAPIRVIQHKHPSGE